MSSKKSHCYKCKMEIQVDVPKTIALKDGRKIDGCSSVDHGCGEEFVQFHCRMDALGFSEDDVNKIFEHAASTDYGKH